MKPAAFAYAAPRSEAEALELKAAHGEEARFLAGGQSLVPAMNFRLSQPAVLIDINRLSSLARIDREADGTIRIGALVRHREVERSALLAREQPLLVEAVRNVAHPQVRNRGTIGGNLANADPASELPAVMVALRARLLARSVRGERWIEAADFFRDIYTTALDDTEMLTEIHVPPAPGGTGACFLEVARRQGDFAMMGVAATVRIDEGGRLADARLVLCSAGPRPVLSRDAHEILRGQAVTEALFEKAAQAAALEIDPIGGLHGSSAYQRHLARVLVARALRIATKRASGGAP